MLWEKKSQSEVTLGQSTQPFGESQFQLLNEALKLEVRSHLFKTQSIFPGAIKMCALNKYEYI